MDSATCHEGRRREPVAGTFVRKIAMRLANTSFKQLIFYGEVVGFLLAWVFGLSVAWKTRPADTRLAGVENFAATTDLRGGQTR